jgi:uncharacterized protein YbjQ (UPF0145 family)
MSIRSIAIPLALAGCAPTTSIHSSSVATRDHQRLVVSPDHSCQPGCPSDHFCNVVEVVDIHTQATSEDKGFDELRTRAAALGADAVMDAEFEHGEGNEPSHLSGTIVRGCERIRPYSVIGAIDVESDPNDADKGMGELRQRRAAMGGDLVIGITFEHGENGAKGHLRGQVVRYTR